MLLILLVFVVLETLAEKLLTFWTDFFVGKEELQIEGGRVAGLVSEIGLMRGVHSKVLIFR